jgi:hypothetical protein
MRCLVQLSNHLYAQVLKLLNTDRAEKLVKELFKYLAASDGGGKSGGKKGKGK